MNTAKVIAAAALLVLTGIASAAHADDVRSQAVRVYPTDVSNVQGARALYARLKTAAVSVCSDQLPDSRQLGMDRVYNACVRNALGHAVLQVNRPLLSAYAAQHGVPVAGAMAAIAANN